MKLTELFDTYSLLARLQPALLVLFPLFVTVAAWVPALYDLSVGLVGLATACGITAFLAHLSRGVGRKVETQLFDLWGGKPTTLWLSHRNQYLDEQTKSRYHKFLENHVPDWIAPSPEQESRDFEIAEVAYESAVRWLRELTRNQEKYSLVFKENVSYGFRRNLYGLKPLGLSLITLCVAGNVGALFYDACVANSTTELATGIGSLMLSLFAVTGWITIVKKSWVKDAADGYARALLATCDLIESEEGVTNK